jgi:hypothetical protein
MENVGRPDWRVTGPAGLMPLNVKSQNKQNAGKVFLRLVVDREIMLSAMPLPKKRKIR